ncbi:hypothetical protein LGK95_20925 [Clostridium algoriphilum]|uniref:hypothetical protein n=1 Tax=Clostridium algoriphilum TaxID=198347 RepID=UPI001CF572C1|nr:hypothetical protein [Clostridium algoriphilum]MCB2295926.1 hypothetical protein [Clostridium algoriphilum]
MKVVDVNGMYTIEVITGGTIVHEFQKGFWKVEDMKRFQADYVAKVAPLLKGKIWAKCSDLTEYQTSSIVDGIHEHITWAAGIGLSNAAIVVSSAIIKMQMNRGDGDIISPKIYDNKSEALNWLEFEGYKG